MRLERDEEQQSLVDAVSAVLRSVVTPDVLHARRDGGPIDEDMWRGVADLGMFSLVLPEADGGLGRPFIDLALVLEQVGRAAMPGPVLETAVVVAPLIAEFATPTIRDRWLDAVVGGSVLATAIVGTDVPATDATEADLVVLLDGRSVTFAAADEAELLVQESADPTRRVAMVSARRSADLELSAATTSLVSDRIAVATAAQLLGNCRYLLDASVEYAKHRRQFSRPIGSFQAVKHHLANVHLELEAAEAAIWVAALQVDESDEEARAIAAAVALAQMSHAALLTNHVALQVHGGIGYTWENDLQLWLKQGLNLARRLGAPHVHRRRAAALAGLGRGS